MYVDEYISEFGDGGFCPCPRKRCESILAVKDLLRHLEKEYACRQEGCADVFCTNKGLQEGCADKFYTSEGLQTHRVANYGKEQYNCFCRKEFAKRGGKVSHKRIHYKDPKNFKVACSKIDKDGLFAIISILRNTLTLEFFRERITPDEADVAEAKYLKEIDSRLFTVD